MEVKTVKINELKEHPKNPRIHPDNAIEKLQKSIKEFGWTNPVLVSKDGFVLAGHARIKAAEKEGLDEVPAIYLDLEGKKADAYLIADNKLQDETFWDIPVLQDLLEELDTGDFDITSTGFDISELEDLIDINGAFTITENEEAESQYTQKIEGPQYEITGDKPELNEIYTTDRHKGLLKEIHQSSLSGEEKEFLKMAATRHIVFSYSKIAEYYAHSSKEMQELMEKSALVIIDYNDAMKAGYIQIKAEVEEMIADEEVGE